MSDAQDWQLAPLPRLDDDAQATMAAPADAELLRAELAALRDELRMVNRQQSKATRILVAAQTEVEQVRLAMASTQARSLSQAALAQQQLLLATCDARDVADRALAQLRQAATTRGPWWRRGRPTPGLQHAIAGAEAVVSGIDRALRTADVVPIATLGLPFDPQQMVAIGVQTDPSQADGLVLAQARGGYRQGTQVLRLPEVLVNTIHGETA